MKNKTKGVHLRVHQENLNHIETHIGARITLVKKNQEALLQQMGHLL